MKIVATFFDSATGDVIDRVETDLRRFIDENPNLPPQYVIREEMRDIGAFIWTGNGVRCEITKR